MSLENPFSRLLISPGAARPTASLAVLEPSVNPDAPIRVQIITVDPKETSFECISYERARDDDSPSVSISVDDQDYEIPEALADALRTFRRKEKPRTLWADVLIGRTPQERTSQAPLLKEILSSAEKTLCWLGKDRAGVTAGAFSTMQDMANQWYQGCLHAEASPEAGVARLSEHQVHGIRAKIHSADFNDLDGLDTQRWVEFDRIFGSTYWTSVQCIAEIVLAKNAIVVCGRSNISWPRYVHAACAFPIVRLRYLPVALLPPVQKALADVVSTDIAVRRRRQGQANALFPMIQTARDLGAKDPRDYVYSMIPICTSSGRVEQPQPQPLPTIDWTKTTTQVFVDAARHIVLDRQDLFVWYNERAPCAKRIRDLPTWVPDFSFGFPNNKPGNIDPNRGLRAWWETIPTRKNIRVATDNDGTNALLVQAYPLQRVEHVSRLFDEGTWAKVVYREYASLPDPVGGETVEQRDERFWRTLLMNSGLGGATLALTEPPGASFGDSFKSIMALEAMYDRLGIAPYEISRFSKSEKQAMQARVETEMPDVMAHLPRGGTTIWPQQFAALFQKLSLGRRFFRTVDGRFGMTAVEDVSCIDSSLFKEERRARGIDPDTDAGFLTRVPQDLTKISGDLGIRLPGLADAMPNFQQFLRERDPAAAESFARARRGDNPSQMADTKSDETGGVAKGDLIVALVGGFWPYVIRPCEKTPEGDDASPALSVVPDAAYEFVGDCYLHGAMDGEDFYVDRPGQSNVNAPGNWVYGTQPFGGRRLHFRTDVSRLVDIRIV